jgi:hypothetical protein
MQRKSGGGSIAAISPAGLGYTADQLAFRKILLDVMFKDNVREVEAGHDCGIGIEGFDAIEAGDIIECYTVEEVATKL